MVWDLAKTDEFRVLVLKIDKLTEEKTLEVLEKFTLLDIYSLKLHDQTMEDYLSKAYNELMRSKGEIINTKKTGIDKMLKNSTLTAQKDVWFDQYFFKNIKLLKMKQNRLFETDFTQIDNLADKEVLNDEFEQFCINSKVDLVRNTDTGLPNKSGRQIKYDFTHPTKFKRFLEYYHKNRNVKKLKTLLFVAVFIYISVLLVNFKIDSSYRQNLIIYENMSMCASVKANQLFLAAQDIQTATMLKSNGFSYTDQNYQTIAQRLRDRITNVRNCSQYIELNQNLFATQINDTIYQNLNSTYVYDYYVLEQWLLATISQLAEYSSIQRCVVNTQ